ncbi:MAG: acylglycerol kinase family protein [Deltaproteobacteria bacterium]|nr:acylglycerol kinase family protein [Deltaproteobacteria bacterium]
MSDAPKALRTSRAVRQAPAPYSGLPGTLKPGKTLRIGVISNPLSGGNRKGMHAIRAALAGSPQAYHFEASTPSEVGEALAEFAHRKVGIVAVNGGDGTIHAVLTELFRRPAPGPVPVLALLRSGTASMIARDVGLSGSRQLALERLLAWIRAGCGSMAVVQRPVLKVERAPDQEPLYGMFFGAACICQGIQYCLNRVHTKGLGGQVAAGLTLARFLISAALGKSGFLSPVPITVGLDSEAQEQQDFLLILISTLERLILGLRTYWGNETGPLCYTALGAHPRHLLWTLPLMLGGWKSRFVKPKYGYFSRKVWEVRLNLSSGFTLDGELYAVDAPVEDITVTYGGQASFLRFWP